MSCEGQGAVFALHVDCRDSSNMLPPSPCSHTSDSVPWAIVASLSAIANASGWTSVKLDLRRCAGECGAHWLAGCVADHTSLRPCWRAGPCWAALLWRRWQSFKPSPSIAQAMVVSSSDAAQSSGDVAPTLVAHRGFVFLDRLSSGTYQLTHTVTCERHMLDSNGAWIMEADDEGFYVLQDLAQLSPEPIFVEDLLKFRLYACPQSGSFTISAEQGGQTQVVHLDQFRLKFVESKLWLSVGPQRAKTEFDLAVFRWARSGARVFISMTSVYHKLGFSHFQGRAWRWVHGGRKQWERAFDEHGLRGHLAFSTQMGKGQAASDAGDASGVLPYNGASLAGIMLLLIRWAHHAERLGGLRDDDHRAATAMMLKSLVQAFVENSPGWSVELDIAKAWQNPWPRPLVCANRAVLDMSSDGILDLTSWAALAEAQGVDSFASQGFRMLSGAHQENRHILKLLVTMSKEKLLKGVFAQLLFQVAMHLQSVIIAGMQRSHDAAGFAVEKTHISELFQTPHKLSETLVRYVAACRSSLGAPRAITICTDKASVGGFSMQCSVLAMASGVAVVMPPQAFSCGDFWGARCFSPHILRTSGSSGPAIAPSLLSRSVGLDRHFFLSQDHIT